MSRSWPSLIGALALAAPSAPATANGIVLAVCGLPGVTVTLPMGDAPMPANHSCCKGACHAGCERKHQRHGRSAADGPDEDGDGD